MLWVVFGATVVILYASPCHNQDLETSFPEDTELLQTVDNKRELLLGLDSGSQQSLVRLKGNCPTTKIQCVTTAACVWIQGTYKGETWKDCLDQSAAKAFGFDDAPHRVTTVNRRRRRRRRRQEAPLAGVSSVAIGKCPIKPEKCGRKSGCEWVAGIYHGQFFDQCMPRDAVLKLRKGESVGIPSTRLKLPVRVPIPTTTTTTKPIPNISLSNDVPPCPNVTNVSEATLISCPAIKELCTLEKTGCQWVDGVFLGKTYSGCMSKQEAEALKAGVDIRQVMKDMLKFSQGAASSASAAAKASKEDARVAIEAGEAAEINYAASSKRAEALVSAGIDIKKLMAKELKVAADAAQAAADSAAVAKQNAKNAIEAAKAVSVAYEAAQTTTTTMTTVKNVTTATTKAR